jgi:asparagine synthase (glutamine-hydrolysing)
MCGIAGIVSFSNNIDRAGLIRNMTDAISHRGPDADGFYVADNVALGHRRLSIIDLSVAANQPIADYTGRYQIIFNGEIYNFREIKQLLPDYPFTTHGDTEVLLAAYAKWGAGCLQYIKGMFLFVIWDTQNNLLFIARDRMGVKPLYYFVNDRCFLFASEIRGILASGLVPKKVNTDAIKEFLSYQSAGSPVSAIDKIVELEAGCYLTIQANKLQIKKYWDITSNPVEFDFNDVAGVKRRVRDLLRLSVERRLISDVPLGAFLSGGIDSSAVVGLMAEVSSVRPNTFTVGFNEQEFDESNYANIIARKFNTNHNQVLLKPAVFLDELTNALNAMDTPSGDGINTYIVSKAIRQSGLTVALSGVGGDELFAGYPFFKKYLQLKKYGAAWPATSLVRKTAALVMGSSNKSRRIKQLLRAPVSSIRYFYPEFRRIITPGLLASLTRWNEADMKTQLEQQLEALPGRLDSFPLLSQVSIAEYLGYTQRTLLKDTDQMSMAVSLEVREPFFDHDLVEFVLAIPDAIKYPAYPKQLLVESLNGLLPDEVVHRKKQGFLFPWSLWMKKELRSFCETHLHRIARRDFIDGPGLLTHWKRFLNNDPDVRWMEIWLFVILEYWMERNGLE